MYVQITQINPVGSDVICDVLHILYLLKRDFWGFLGILLLLFTLGWTIHPVLDISRFINKLPRCANHC